MISQEDFLDPNHPLYNKTHPAFIHVHLADHLELLESGNLQDRVHTTMMVMKLTFTTCPVTYCEQHQFAFALQKRLPDGQMEDEMLWTPADWYRHLKKTVALGKGWNRDDIHI